MNGVQQHILETLHEIRARFERLHQLARVERDADLQKVLLASKGARKDIKKPSKASTTAISNGGGEMEDPDDGVFGQRDKPKYKDTLPKPEVGVRTGARVWVSPVVHLCFLQAELGDHHSQKWKAGRKR